MAKTVARAAALLLSLVLAGCGGESSHSAGPASSGSTVTTGAGPSSPATAPVTTSAPAPGFASTSAGTPQGQLSKPDFLIRMNSLCSSVDAQLKALPTPTAATDYAAISAALTGRLRLMPSFLTRAEALVAQSAQRAELEKNWLAVSRADFAAFTPPARRMLAHSKAQDAAKVQADANALSALPDHSSRLAHYLTGFGLGSCAQLESR